jgi:hypothetical protein
LRHAGFDIRSIPATPERVMTAARLAPPGGKRRKLKADSRTLGAESRP